MKKNTKGQFAKQEIVEKSELQKWVESIFVSVCLGIFLGLVGAAMF
jgi:hypothetical protein